MRKSILIILSTAVIFAGPANAYLFYGNEGRTIQIGQPIKPEELKHFRKINPHSVYFFEGADRNLFSDATLFPHLREVGLSFDDPDWIAEYDKFSSSGEKDSFTQLAHIPFSAQDFDTVLVDLTKNYSNIAALYIYRKQKITQLQLEELPKFVKLRSLTLRGPLGLRGSLATNIPRSLRILSLEDPDVSAENLKLGNLNSLKELNITNCDLPKEINQFLEAPQLKIITLAETKLGQHFFDNTDKFPRLRTIQLINSPVDNETLSRWSSHVTVRVESSSGWDVYPKSRPRKESSM